MVSLGCLCTHIYPLSLPVLSLSLVLIHAVFSRCFRTLQSPSRNPAQVPGVAAHNPFPLLLNGGARILLPRFSSILLVLVYRGLLPFICAHPG
ncbi:hypothetical protein BV20DRAFT_720035 [Pilatotrama ljubarskyi]|nr:hypothetical protein BV20DRAFT_720035 [Pilatotrama ljubarskyi]